MTPIACAWVLDSGGAGRGAWQGGLLHELMQWTREHASYPLVSMGASAGGYAAADVATGTEHTVMKGWTAWGTSPSLEAFPLPPDVAAAWPPSRFRRHLHASIRYVMGPTEVEGVFDGRAQRKLLVFTSRVRRRDGRPMERADLLRLFAIAASRKWPRALKYRPRIFDIEPVVFATHLPQALESEHVRPLTRSNYHCAIEASCLVPIAMGPPLPPALVSPGRLYPRDETATFIDGGFSLKMPMAAFADDPRFAALGQWASTARTVVFCCDPKGHLWETSLRLRSLRDHPAVSSARTSGSLLVLHPDHDIEAGFLCLDPDVTMRTFARGQDQGRRLLASDHVRRFLAGAPLN
ncbi:MAG: patatin-like phospholipase family protein [Vicinamibacterales bacterium]